MNKSKARMTAVILAPLTLVALMGAGSAAKSTTPPPVKGGNLKVAILNDVDGLDPQKTVSASTFEVSVNIYDSLIRSNPNGKLVPDLALSWKAENGAKTWVVKLRKGIKFQDGEPFNAKDVAFTFKRMEDPATKAPHAKDYSIISKVQVDNPYQVTFQLTTPTVAFPAMLAYPWAAMLPIKAAANLSTHPVGTGPFKFVSWTPQQSIKLERHPDYFGKVYLDSAEFDVIPDPGTQLVDLQSGQVDVAAIADPSQASTIASTPNLKLLNKPSNLVQVMSMNNAVAPLNNVKVRQAINYAINKKAVIRGALWGYGVPIGSHMPPGTPDYINLNSTYPYNPAKAKALLKEAGYPNGFSITITLPQPYLVYLQMGQVIQQQLAKVGIHVTLHTVDWGTWLSQVYFGRQYQMTIIGHTGRLDAGDLLAMFNSTSSTDYMNVKDSQIDTDLTKAARTVQPAARKKLYQDIQKRLAADASAVWLDTPDSMFGMQKNVYGWETYPIDIYDLRTVYKSGQ